MRMGTGGLIFH
ncbi:Protein of unknown function [Bacillus wiedmannii]|uniref:Uncharacterized protein n=1 Tax=Bacillus wiedmannii TaxID=1890302 RepID=A0AB37YKY1_9BACI|nr:Protein of unknown function [Bacillus wiedmannii]